MLNVTPVDVVVVVVDDAADEPPEDINAVEEPPPDAEPVDAVLCLGRLYFGRPINSSARDPCVFLLLAESSSILGRYLANFLNSAMKSFRYCGRKRYMFLLVSFIAAS